uniref:Uncharacterized protein n=1 Tax=Solanum tuberosum TaxID=4113 RepID=M1DCH6_SOLTU
MARPKVAGRDDPPRHVRAREFRKEEKRAEMARKRKYTKEARKKRRITFDLNVRPCDRSLVNAVHAFRATHEINQMIAANLAIEAKAKANSGDKNDNALGTIVLLQKMHRALIARQMERLLKQDPLFTSLYVFLSDLLDTYYLHLRTNAFYLWWDEAYTFCVDNHILFCIYLGYLL